MGFIRAITEGKLRTQRSNHSPSALREFYNPGKFESLLQWSLRGGVLQKLRAHPRLGVHIKLGKQWLYLQGKEMRRKLILVCEFLAHSAGGPEDLGCEFSVVSAVFLSF